MTVININARHITDEDIREPGNGFRMLVPGDLIIQPQPRITYIVLAVDHCQIAHHDGYDEHAWVRPMHAWVVRLLLKQDQRSYGVVRWIGINGYKFLVDPKSNRLIRDGWYTPSKVIGVST